MYNHSIMTALVALSLSAMALPVCYSDETERSVDKELSADLALLQGKWEMKHGSKDKVSPTTHSIKTIEGNKENIQRFDIATGKMIGERTVEFALGKSGSLRTYTFFPVGGARSEGTTHVYKIENETLFEVTGLLQGTGKEKLPSRFTVSRWKRGGRK